MTSTEIDVLRVTGDLHAHMADWIAPVAVHVAFADGAHLERILRRGGQIDYRHHARAGENPGALPRSCRVAGNRGDAQVVSSGVRVFLDLEHKLRRVAVIHP